MRVTSQPQHMLVLLTLGTCVSLVGACETADKCGTPPAPCNEVGGSGGTSGSGGSGGSGGTAGMSGSGGSGGTAGMSGSGGSGGIAGSGGSGGASGCTEPLDAPIPNCHPTAPESTGDIAQDCVNRINQLRAECQCLPPLTRWTEGEACADEQAEYDSVRDDPHAGFGDGICDGGSGQNECPGWGSERQTITGCLQQMWDEGPGEPFSAHGHYINMTDPDHDRVACGFFTTQDGEVWAVQNFR